MEKSWVLIGMMGAGKTSLGRVLAEITGRRHIDTDQLLQQRLGRPIPQLFNIYGEEAFRDHETSILKSLAAGDAVVSTGGGIVTKEANWTEMRRIGTTVYIEVDYPELVERLSTSKKKRPLLNCEDWHQRLQELLDQRRPLYGQADVIVQIGKMNAEQSAQAVLARMETFR